MSAFCIQCHAGAGVVPVTVACATGSGRIQSRHSTHHSPKRCRLACLQCAQPTHNADAEGRDAPPASGARSGNVGHGLRVQSLPPFPACFQVTRMKARVFVWCSNQIACGHCMQENSGTPPILFAVRRSIRTIEPFDRPCMHFVVAWRHRAGIACISESMEPAGRGMAPGVFHERETIGKAIFSGVSPESKQGKVGGLAASVRAARSFAPMSVFRLAVDGTWMGLRDGDGIPAT